MRSKLDSCDGSARSAFPAPLKSKCSGDAAGVVVLVAAGWGEGVRVSDEAEID
jgi:hypothetical protein